MRDTQSLEIFTYKKDDLISARPTIKKTFRILDFVVPPDHRVKLGESEKKAKYFDLARELRKKKKKKKKEKEKRGTWKWWLYQL